MGYFVVFIFVVTVVSVQVVWLNGLQLVHIIVECSNVLYLYLW